MSNHDSWMKSFLVCVLRRCGLFHNRAFGGDGCICAERDLLLVRPGFGPDVPAGLLSARVSTHRPTEKSILRRKAGHVQDQAVSSN